MTITHPGMLTEDEFLEHYGVKGMKWGVLREQAAAGDRGAQKKLAKADEKMKKYNNTAAAWVEAHNLVADKMNGPFGLIAKHNSNPKWAGIKDYRDETDPKVIEYMQDFQRISSKAWAETVKELNPETPSGKYTCVVKEDANGLSYADMVETATLQHADTNSIKIRLLRDSIGRVVGLGEILSDDAIQHSTKKGSIMSNDNTPDTLTHGMMSEDEFLTHIGATADMSEDEFLEHFGVKGMRWGQSGAGKSPRKTADGRDRKPRAELRQLNKATKLEQRSTPAAAPKAALQAPNRTHFSNKEDFAKAKVAYNKTRDAGIDAARARVDSGANRQNYIAAKQKYKSEKYIVGSVRAKQALNKVHAQNVADYAKSQEAKSGRETTAATITAVASILMSSLAAAKTS